MKIKIKKGFEVDTDKSTETEIFLKKKLKK